MQFLTVEQGIELAKQLLSPYKIYGTELVSKCPFCQSDRHKFYLNINTGLYNCKRASCGTKGNLNTLFEHLGRDERVQYEGYELKQETQKYLKVDSSKFHNISENSALSNYMMGRGISLDTLNKCSVLTNSSEDRFVFITTNNEQPVDVTYRSMDKKIHKESGSKQYLWNREHLNYSKDLIIITEGRIDAMTLIEMGYDNVVSMPNGASSHEWITQEWGLLNKFSSILLLYDNDDAGKKGMDLAKLRLDFALLYEINLGKYNDINDAYMQDAEFLYSQMNSPRQIELDGFISLEDVSTSDGVNTELYSCGITQFDRIFGGVRLGESTIIASPSGTGKSTILCNMVKGLLSQNQKCGVYSGELTNASLKAWLYSVIGGANAVQEKPHPFRKGEFLTSIKPENESEIDAKVRGRLYIYDGGKSDGFLMLKHFSNLNKRFGVKFFFIDNLSILSTSVRGVGQYEGEDMFAKALAEFCRTHRAHVFLFAHPTKQSLNTDADFITKDGKVKPIQRYDQYSIRGSASFANLSHNIMFLMRAKDWERQYFIQKLSDIYEKSGKINEWKELREILLKDFSLFAYLVKNRGAGKTYEDILFGYDSATRRIYGLTTKDEDLSNEVEVADDISYEDDDIDYMSL